MRFFARAAAALLALVAIVAGVAVAATGPPAMLFVLVSLATGLMFGLTGLLLVALRPGNLLGPVLAVAGSAVVLEYALREYAFRGLPLADWAAWAGMTIDPLFFPVPVGLILVLFPDGRLPSRLWRPVVAVGALLVVAGILGSALRRGPLRDESYGYDVPWRGVLPITPGQLDVVTSTGLLVLLAGVVGLMVRLFRATGERRRRLVPPAVAGALAVVFLVVQNLPGLHDLGVAGLVVSVTVGLPVALAVGALRYRVWDLDEVLIGAVVYGTLTVLITALYVGVVTAIGGLGASVAATALVAAGFAPVKDRLSRAARRLVLGVRASPYEALAALPRHLADAPVAADVLPGTARALTEGLGVPAARVRTSAGAVAWSGRAGDERDLVVVGVQHLGVPVGDVAVRPSPDRPLSSSDHRLLADLAAQAGPARRGAILAGELADRLEELRASRERIVAAETRGRRRLERDIHDGVQQHLVALAVSLRAGATAEAQEHLDRCLQDLRDLARGIYPPVLATRGLLAALKARARDAPGNVRVVAGPGLDGPRPGEDVELAAYFACLEALQNAAKHAPGAAVLVTVDRDGDRLCFTVADDGPGFDVAA
ncbi:histidine kinase, partial [Actinoplanes sp. NPDC051633]|uniref:sensor histidine kinase n=1 Tax=Actinoplanes sp. NPDC051633 TaxID=3155670 RepID=UPI003435F8FA